MTHTPARLRTRALTLLLTAAGLALPAARAAAPQPVHWQLTGAPHNPVHPGQKFDLTLTGRIDPGWHLYALDEPDGGPIATQVSLTDGDPADLLRVTAAKPETIEDPQFNMQTALYVNTAAFTLHLQAPREPSAPTPQTLHILIRYQSCNNQVCLPPHTDTVPVAVTYAP